MPFSSIVGSFVEGKNIMCTSNMFGRDVRPFRERTSMSTTESKMVTFGQNLSHYHFLQSSY